MNTIAVKMVNMKSRTAAVLGVAAAVILPQIFHAIGIISGTGAVPGTIFLPMHLPVMFIGLMYGAGAGAVCGILSPVVSMMLTGMPNIAMLPFMTAELAVYGFCTGYLNRFKMPDILKVLIAQAAGRAVRSAGALLAVYFASGKIGAAWNYIPQGLAGIVIQLCVLPLLVYRIKSAAGETKND